MAQLWTRVMVSAFLLSVGSAESTTVVTPSPHTPIPSTVHTSPTVSTHSKSSSLTPHVPPSSSQAPYPQSSSNAPHVTPIPSSGPSLNRYVLDSTDPRQSKSDVCLLMESRIELMFKYDTKESQEGTLIVPIGSAAVVDGNKSACKLSTCSEPSDAALVVDYQDFSIYLTFNETEDTKHWVFGSFSVKYLVSNKYFTNLKDSSLYGKTVEASSQESLFDWTTPQVMLLSSYKCMAKTTFKHFNNSMTNGVIRVSLSFSDLQVQAFKFDKNGTHFDDEHTCYADRNIVVPIAVAAALALLASTVLVLTLIKLCWRKCKERSVHTKYKRLSADVQVEY